MNKRKRKKFSEIYGDNNSIFSRIGMYIATRSMVWKRSVSFLACVVVFVVTYALILPAISLEEDKAEEAGVVLENSTEAVTAGGDDFQDTGSFTNDDFEAMTAEEKTVSRELLSDFSEETIADDAAEPEKTYADSPLTYETDTYTAQIRFDDAAQIPLDTKFTLSPVGGVDFQNYFHIAGEKLDADLEADTGAFYQISLVSDGSEVVPSAPVDVVIEYKENSESHPGEAIFAVSVDRENSTNGEIVAFRGQNPDASNVVNVSADTLVSLCFKNCLISEQSNTIGFVTAKEAQTENREDAEVVSIDGENDTAGQVDVVTDTAEEETVGEEGVDEPEADGKEDVDEPEADGEEGVDESEADDEEGVDEPEADGKEGVDESEADGEEGEDEPEVDDEEGADESEADDEEGADGSEADGEESEDESEAGDEEGVDEPESEEENAEDAEEDILTWDGADYTVTLTYTEDAQIPADATLSVRELIPGTSEYEQYLISAKQALGLDESATLPAEQARFFDITILAADGETELEPKAAVTVQITYDDPVTVPDTDQMNALHFADEAAEPEILKVQDIQTEAHDETAVTAVAFDSESFSVFGIVYTVDFYYGGYEYHLDGEGEILLSELFELLKIDEDASLVKSAVFSNPELVAVEQTENDWLLTSLKPFDTTEKLTVTMVNGTVYEIRVEDETDVSNIKVTLVTSPINSVNYGHFSITTKLVSGNDTNTTFKLPDGQYDINSFIDVTAANSGNPSIKYNIFQNSNSTLRNSSAWRKATDNEGVFVGFIADKDIYMDTNEGSKLITANTLITEDNKRFNFSETTTMKALFKQSGKTLFYYITDGNGTVNGDDSAIGYKGDALPTLEGKGSNVFLGWEVDGKMVDDLGTISGDSVVKAIFGQRTNVTITYKNVINGNVASTPHRTETVTYGGTAVGDYYNSDQEGFIAWRDGNGKIVSTDYALNPSNCEDLKNVTENKTFYGMLLKADDRLLGYSNMPEVINWRSDSKSENYSGINNVWASPLYLKYGIYFWLNDGYELDSVTYNGTTLPSDAVDYSQKYGYWSIDRVYLEDNKKTDTSTPNTLVVNIKEAGTYTVTYIAETGGQVENPSGVKSPSFTENVKGGVAQGATAVANNTYYFSHWENNHYVVSGDEIYWPSDIMENTTFNAIFYNNPRIVFYPSMEGQLLNGPWGDQKTVVVYPYNNNGKVKIVDSLLFKYWEMDGEFYSIDQTLNINQVNNDRKKGTPDHTFVRAVYSDNTGYVIGYKVEGGHGHVTNSGDVLPDIQGSTAVPDEGYIVDEWYYYTKPGDESTKVVLSNNETITASNLTSVSSNIVVYVSFKQPATRSITYQASNGTLKANDIDVSKGPEFVETVTETSKGFEAVGATSSANSDKTFICWRYVNNEKSIVVSTSETFVPSGDQIVDGRTYTAMYGQTPYVMPSVNNEAWGTVAHSGESIELNMGSDNMYQLKSTITATANEGYEFDHWELAGETLTHTGSTISTSDAIFSNYTGLKTLTAVFKPKGSIKVIYQSENTDQLTVSNTVDYVSPSVPGNGSSATEKDGFALDAWYIGSEKVFFSYSGTLGSSEVTYEAIEHYIDAASQTVTIYARPCARPTKYMTFTARTETGDASQGYFSTNSTGGYSLAPNTQRYSTIQHDNGKIYYIEGGVFARKSPRYVNSFYNSINGSANDGYRFAFWMDNFGRFYSNLTGSVEDPDPGDNTVTHITFTAYFSGADEIRIAYRTEAEGKLKRNNEVVESGYYVTNNQEGGATAVPDIGYVFAGWFDQNNRLVSTSETFDVSTATYDMALTAKYRSGNQVGTVQISVNDLNMGDVELSGGSKVSTANNNKIDVATEATGVIAQTITARAKEGYALLYWTLNGVETALATTSIEGNTLVLSDGDELKAVFGPVTYIDSDGNASADVHPITIGETKKKELQKWLDELKNQSALHNVDKTAQVYDYDNRIYQIDITAESNLMSLQNNIDVGFILDASNSMKFPSKLKRLELEGEDVKMVLTQSNLDWLAVQTGQPNGPFYIISDPKTSSTVFRIYKLGGLWRYTDAAYDRTDIVSWNGMERYSEKASNNTVPPYSFPIYIDDEVGMHRVDYLNSGMKDTIDSMYQIMKNLGENTNKIRVAYNTFAMTVSTLDPDSVFVFSPFKVVDDKTSVRIAKQEGGTRQDLGLWEASGFGWDKNPSTKKYAILITDGAPVVSSSDTLTAEEIIENIDAQAAALKAQGITLITIGLSTKNVDGGSNTLYRIASKIPDENGVKQFYEAESGEDLEAILLQILRTIISHSQVRAEVTDTLDKAFYPVQADGTPITAGIKYGVDGNQSTDESAPYYIWTETDGVWTITWYNQVVGWDEDDESWTGTIYAKAKEDFLGGNKIPTNAGNSNKITVKQYRISSANEWVDKENVSAELPLPYVNVDELHLTENSTEWTVYLGTEVDPEAQLNALWNEIVVKQVVKEGGTTADSTKITGKDKMYYAHDSNVNSNDTEAPTSGYASLHLSHYGLEDYKSALLTAIKTGNNYTSGEILYKPYNNKQVGYFTITANKVIDSGAKNAVSKAPTKHRTDLVGDKIEQYKISITYTPLTEDAKESYPQTTEGGSAGKITDPQNTEDVVKSENSHVINVFAKSLQITKIDQTYSQVLKGAKFDLYRTARSAESDTVSLSGVTGKFVKIGEFDCSSGIATRQFKVEDASVSDSEKLYLVESQTPAGYNALTAPIEVKFGITDKFVAVPGQTENASKPSGLYNWEETAELYFVTSGSDGVFKRTGADGTDLTNAGNVSNDETETLYYKIMNSAGIELPATGGPGTRIFYLFGSILIFAAGFGLVRRRRVQALSAEVALK